MAQVVLGATPASLEVVLTSNADFFCTLETEDLSNWPAGIQIKLILDTQEFLASIVGPDANIAIDSADVNTLISKRVRHAKLMYIDGAAEICWAVGVVVADG